MRRVRYYLTQGCVFVLVRFFWTVGHVIPSAGSTPYQLSDVDNGETFIIMPSEKRFISEVGEKVWSGTFDFNQMILFGMGVRFIHISPDDRQYLAVFVEEEQSE